MKLIQKIRRSKVVGVLRTTTQRIVLPGFEGMNIYTVGKIFLTQLVKGEIFNRAAAISFKIILASFPALIVLISLIPYVPIENFQQDLIEGLRHYMPGEVYEYFKLLFEGLILQKHSTALSIGFILSLYYASSSINAIFSGFQKSQNIIRKRKGVKNLMMAFFIMILITVLIILAFVVQAFSNSLISYLFSSHTFSGNLTYYLLYLIKWATIGLFFLIAISLLYNAGSPGKKWRLISTGAVFTTLMFIIINTGFSMYVGHFNVYNGLYGSLGGVLIVLMTIYFNAIILLIGFELNMSINAAKTRLTS